MKIVRAAAELQSSGRPVCVAIGVFDGVHLGHQQVIRRAQADAAQHDAQAVVVTFDRHPKAIVAPEHVPALIYSLPQKLRAIDRLGVEAAWIIQFDREFSARTGEVFVRGLAHDMGRLLSVSVGSEFTFGARRSGNVTLLRQLGLELGFNVHGLAAVSLDGEVVSSTRIREAIVAGELDAASQMLGRVYSLAATVIPGDRVGRTLGFPTANLEVRGLVLPPGGVYAARALAGGTWWRSVVNIGWRPTLEQAAPSVHVEVHLLDFSGDLYERELELVFMEKLRGERKFPSLDELRVQIGEDVALARKLFEA